MPPTTKKRPPEDEAQVREGSGAEKQEGKKPDSPFPPKGTNRKRSAKGAKNTTPAPSGEGPDDDEKEEMEEGETNDGEACGTCASGKCGCKSCKTKRGDASPEGGLTPRRLRQFREDLKCGKGAISKGEKCTKGPATAGEQQAPKGRLFGRNFRQELKANSAAREANQYQAWRDKNKLGKPKGMTEFYAQSKQYAQSEEFNNAKQLWAARREINQSATKRNLVIAGGVIAGGVATLLTPRGGRAFKRTFGKRDASPFASGFTVDYDQLAV